MKDFFQKFFGRKPAPPREGRFPPNQQCGAKPRCLAQVYGRGDRIAGEFEVIRTLGQGGFGIVYLVSDARNNTLRAIKTFRDEFMKNQGTRDAFEKEALLWVNLGEHPAIISARWVQRSSGRLFVLMDYVPADTQGRVTLADHLAPMPYRNS